MKSTTFIVACLLTATMLGLPVALALQAEDGPPSDPILAELRALRRDLSEMRTLIDRSRNLEERIVRLEARNRELEHTAQVARAVAHQLNVKLAEVEDALAARLAAADAQDGVDTAPTRQHTRHTTVVTGVIAAVKDDPAGEQDLVMVTVGATDELQEGTELIVFRSSQYICKIRVERVMQDMAACRIIPESRNVGGLSVQAGDHCQARDLFGTDDEKP